MDEPPRDDKISAFAKKFPSQNFYAYERNFYFSCDACVICLGKLVEFNYPVTLKSAKINDNVELLNCLNSQEAVKQCCHKFHKNCINSWLQTHDNCPVCRRRVETKRTIQKSAFDLLDADFQTGGKRSKTRRGKRV